MVFVIAKSITWIASSIYNLFAMWMWCLAYYTVHRTRTYQFPKYFSTYTFENGTQIYSSKPKNVYRSRDMKQLYKGKLMQTHTHTHTHSYTWPYNKTNKIPRQKKKNNKNIWKERWQSEGAHKIRSFRMRWKIVGTWCSSRHISEKSYLVYCNGNSND